MQLRQRQPTFSRLISSNEAQQQKPKPPPPDQPSSTQTSRNAPSMTSNHKPPPPIRQHKALICSSCLLLLLSVFVSTVQLFQEPVSFPGVDRDLASFCSARPSLSVDLSPMVVHVKRNNSFNYKLYLFSGEYVFQTGQIVPRDNFRIHSFPVKFKTFNEFWPPNQVPTFIRSSAASNESHPALNESHSSALTQVPSSKFNVRKFFKLVPLNPREPSKQRTNKRKARDSNTRRQHQENSANVKKASAAAYLPSDTQGDVLPGDSEHHSVAIAKPDEAANVNRHIQFDRDDQVSLLNDNGQGPLDRQTAKHERDLAGDQVARPKSSSSPSASSSFLANNKLVLPIGTFSSFQVNLTYLVRKDFDQPEPELVEIRIDPADFQVKQVNLLQINSLDGHDNHSVRSSFTNQDAFNFLSHKLLRDPNTRIVSINQIYENWITRNFYTIVYIQRRLDQTADKRPNSEAPASETDEAEEAEVVSDRLIFRGSSMVLLGAEQLDYQIKSSAFITEKNNLHYFLEFLTNGKFYLGAIDWSKRPFKFINWQKFPQAKATRTQFDNEELLLCPPAVCYSEQPIDELVPYGRLAISEHEQEFVRSSVLVPGGYDRAANRTATTTAPKQQHQLETTKFYSTTTAGVAPFDVEDVELVDHRGSASLPTATAAPNKPAHNLTLDDLVDSIRRFGAGQLEVRLHLRDWLWTLTRQQEQSSGSVAASDAKSDLSTASLEESKRLKSNETSGGGGGGNKFVYHFEWARRNDLRVSPDSYGFVLSGQEIDASYRVFNELYLVSTNQLITINYTLANETVTSTQPIGDEFPGLSSSLLDPITGAYYDRNSNQIYFFKGDRYVGYDYATKKPLEDFQLPPTTMIAAPSTSTTTTSTFLNQQQQPLVLSLPVVGILGRQHSVDGVYHDLHTDFVYIFTGMKFYTFRANEFKDGAFRNDRGQPPMLCINEQLLDGCQFDEAFPNPCKAGDDGDEENRDTDDFGHLIEEDQVSELNRKQNATSTSSSGKQQQSGAGRLAGKLSLSPNQTLDSLDLIENNNNNYSDANFNRDQQLKLRSIAARGGGLLDYLVENTVFNRGAIVARGAVEPILTTTDMMIDRHHHSSSHERIVIYMLIAMVAITILVTVAMIVVIINWSHGLNQQQGTKEEDKKQQPAKNGDESDDGDDLEGALAGTTMNNFNNVLQQYHNNLIGQSQFQRPSRTNSANPWNQQHFAPPTSSPAAGSRQQRHMSNSYLARQLIGDSLPPQPQAPPVNSVFVLPPVKQHHAGRGGQQAGTASSSSSTARQKRATGKIDSSAL